MRCPSCGSLDTQVKDSRPTEDSAVIRRRRVCLTCNFRFTTFERVQLRELTVIKRNGRRVPFDRDKLMRSVQIALRKRPVEPERIEQVCRRSCASWKAWARTRSPRRPSARLVMEHLRELDDVAYVRFASVYRNFREAKDFRAALDELSGEDERQARDRAQMSLPAEPSAADAAADDARFMALALPLGRRGLGQHLAQSGGRRGDRQGRRHRRPRLDASRRPAACRGRGAAPRQEGRARRDAST